MRKDDRRAARKASGGRVRFARGGKPAKPRPVRRDAEAGPSIISEIGKMGLKSIGRFFRLVLIALATLTSVAAAAALLVAGYLYISKSDYFQIKNVTISGNVHTSGREVEAAAGLIGDVNIWSFDPVRATTELSTLPWVARASVSKKMPDMVSISITEHNPRVLVNLGRLHYMNDAGEPFKELLPGENPNLPIVSGFVEDELLMNPGPRVREALKEVFWLMDTLSARNDEFRLDNISEINYDMVRGLTLFTKSGGLEVKIGFGSYEEKFRRLGRVLAHLKMGGKYDGLVYLNLEASPRVTVRYDHQRVGSSSALWGRPGLVGGLFWAQGARIRTPKMEG